MLKYSKITVCCIIFSLVQASGLEHLIKDDISDTGKNKFDVVRIGGRSQMWIDWPFFQIDLTLAQKSIDYEVRGFCHIVFTLKSRKIVWLPDYYYHSILEMLLKNEGGIFLTFPACF